MSASMFNHPLSWNRVLPAPDALLNGQASDLLPRRSSSLLQHHLVCSKDLLESSKDRRSTVPSISYHVHPAITPINPVSLHGSQNFRASEQHPTGSLTRKHTATLMAEDLKARETSPVPTQDSIPEATDQFCLCQPDPKIPRPRNAFILYRQHHQAAVVAKHPGLPNPEISKIIGEEWRALPTKTKNEWKALAEDEKLRHQQQYPDYRYQPRRFGRSGNVQAAFVPTSADPSGHCLRCGGKTMNPPVTPHTPIFPANEGPRTNMMRSPSTINAAATQTSGRPRPLAHANLHRQVPYTMSSPPPPGSAVARVRPFGEAFAGGMPQPMTEAEYRARFGSQPRSPDPKRRCFNGPGVMVPGRGPDLTSPTVPYPRSHPYSPRRVSLPRPIDGTTRSVHQRAVTQGQIQRSAYPPQHPRYAPVDSRDTSLTLAPLQTPTSAAAPTGPNGSKRSSCSSTAEAQIMSIPAVNKLRLLAKAAPPLPHPGSVVKTQGLNSTSFSEARGAILAIDGSEEDVQMMTEWLGDFLRNESDEFLVKGFLGPNISAVMAGAHAERDVDMVGTQQQRYLKVISEWHWVSNEVVKFVTTRPKTKSGGLHDSSVAAADTEKAKNSDEKMDMDPSASPVSAVSPRTISQTQRLSLKSPNINSHTNDGNLNEDGSHNDEVNDDQVMATSAPTATKPHIVAPAARTSPSTTPPPPPPPPPSQSATSKPFPIALLHRYQLSTVDTASLVMPITDSYLPIDHWQWAAALWRGCVGPDVTVVIQEESSMSSGSLSSAGGGSSNGSAGSSSTSGAGSGVEVRLGQGDVRAVIVRKGGAGRVLEPGALRRVGFEIVEFLRR